jgi:HD-GYP domain-containing protein (c-di-GMP phosphodiesterase class II)
VSGDVRPAPVGVGAEAPVLGSSDRQLQQAGRAFILALHGATRSLKLYPLENRVVQDALDDLSGTTAGVLRSEGEVNLRLVGEVVFLNDLRIRADLSSYGAFAGVGAMLKRHGIGELRVEGEVRRQDWIAVLTLLQGEGDGADPFGAFRERLGHLGVGGIDFEPETDPSDRSRDDGSRRAAARRTYVQSVNAAREVLTASKLGKAVSLRRVKRAVQSIVDQVLADETYMLGMTNLREYDEYTFTHCVNVSIFAVSLGKKIGLDRTALYELGLGGLLHDAGKASLPIEIIAKPGPLTDAEWAALREHPTEGLLAAFEMQGLSELPLRALRAVYEHHMKIDGTGYPASKRARETSLFARIVAIADGFDAATSVRSYQKVPLTPDGVLREMRDNPERGLDPLLVKAFISMTGVYPVGTVAVLDTYELAVVVAPASDPGNFDRPVVRIAYDERGLLLDPPPTVDLAEVDPRSGEYRRSIVKATDPERYGIDVAWYFS